MILPIRLLPEARAELTDAVAWYDFLMWSCTAKSREKW